VFKCTAPGTYYIRLEFPQNEAISHELKVINGDASTEECNGCVHGICDQGVCHCESIWTGADCSTISKHISHSLYHQLYIYSDVNVTAGELGTPLIGSLAPQEQKYFSFLVR
jgi:hypothetical protein